MGDWQLRLTFLPGRNSELQEQQDEFLLFDLHDRLSGVHHWRWRCAFSGQSSSSSVTFIENTSTVQSMPRPFGKHFR
jgi:hypothetical protein